MLPKTHVLLGALLSVIVWYIAPQISWINLTLLFLSSFLIDFDHYMAAAQRNRSLSLFKAFKFFDILEKEEKEREKKEKCQPQLSSWINNFFLFLFNFF
jgi:hypothetical protein